ncbi:MAG: YitT family protein [Lachnospiraceae bacterium]|nr:YitT family protein [Lachnospiraceae bacterium]
MSKKDIKRIVVIFLCSIGMALNIKILVRAGGLYPGGATGLTILILRVMESFFSVELSYSLVNILINIFPVYIGFRFIGKKFTMYSCLVILLTGIFTDLIPAYVLTEDVLLISIFGGIINGFVVSMCLSVDATTGGTDFIGIYLSQKKGVDSFNLVLGINAVILCISGILFGWDKALYSIIFQYASTVALHTFFRMYQQDTLLIVTQQPEEVARAIYVASHHGATILEGEGAFGHSEKDIVYSVIASSQTRRVIQAIKEVDENVFINHLKTQEIIGRFYQPPKD